MRRFLFAVFFLWQPLAVAQTLDLSGYQREDGAITTKFGGDKVDPYFATKALLAAQDHGLNIRTAAREWIVWALKMQRPDGLFERYQQVAPGAWQAYAGTDADDAMSALWIELLYNQAPKSGVPKLWRESVARAEMQLEKLYDPVLGIYYISSTNPVGLLMDNMEVYAAFRRIAAEQKRFGFHKNARLYSEKADRLGDDILRVFGADPNRFTITTQARDENEFYPDKVGQIYPVLYGLPAYDDRVLYADWIAENEKEWIDFRLRDYPWGIVALLALKMNDDKTAACWQNFAEPLRYSERWNVLEEVALQSVRHHLVKTNFSVIPCLGKVL